jgi:predicted RNA-binding Zn ribbon-like protein
MTYKIQVRLDTLNLEAGELCLDFANTANWHASAEPVEGLNSYTDLATWSKEVGLLNGSETEQLLQQALARPTETGAILAQAIDLREAIYRIFSATAKKDSPQDTDLTILNTALQQAFTHLQIAQAQQNFTWQWIGDERSLDLMLWPVARSAAELLTSDRLERVKECEDDRGCGFLFLDLSKNRSRRWCDMESCGNRAKVRRYRRRQG